MNEFQTIKELVIETCINTGEFPSYEKLTSSVLKHFPDSKWQKSHYAWYKSKIKTGAIQVPGFENSTEIDADNVDDNEIIDSINASLSLEKDLHSYLAARVNEIEDGLSLADEGIEYQTSAGRIDILANSSNGDTVVIELKAGKAKDNALGQLLGYMGCLAEKSSSPIRGILIASDFDQRVIYASRSLPQIKLLKYKVLFDLSETI